MKLQAFYHLRLFSLVIFSHTKLVLGSLTPGPRRPEGAEGHHLTPHIAALGSSPRTGVIHIIDQVLGDTTLLSILS